MAAIGVLGIYEITMRRPWGLLAPPASDSLLPQRLADGASALEWLIIVPLAMPAQLCNAPSRDQRQKLRLVSVQKRDNATGQFGSTTAKSRSVAKKKKAQNTINPKVHRDCYAMLHAAMGTDDKKTFNKLPYLSEMITRILEDYGFRVDPVSWVAYKVNAFVMTANERALET